MGCIAGWERLLAGVAACAAPIAPKDIVPASMAAVTNKAFSYSSFSSEKPLFHLLFAFRGQISHTQPSLTLTSPAPKGFMAGRQHCPHTVSAAAALKITPPKTT